MRLTRITKIQDHRVFREFRWPKELAAFGQFNLIYGWNGSGKTTLSSLLSLVEKRVALTEGEIELEFDNTTKVTGTELIGTHLPDVRVFNREFVNATLHSTGEITPIYFLGEDSIEKQARVEQLKKELASANAEVTAARSAKTSAETELDKYCVDRAKAIKELLTTANSQTYNNYDKGRFKRAVKELTAEKAGASLLNDEQKLQLRSQKDERPKPNISTVTVPAVDLAALTTEVNAIVGRSVVAQTLEELTSNTLLAAWIQQGIALHSGEHATGTCRFCHQPFDAKRRSALEAHFNDAFARFQEDLVALLTKLEEAKETACSLSLPDASRFYEALSTRAAKASAAVRSAQSETAASVDALIGRIEAKRDHPFAPSTAPTPAPAASTSIAECVAALNTIVESHNRISTEFKSSVDKACKELEDSYVAESYDTFVQLSEGVATAKSAVEIAEAGPTGIKAQIDELERTILEHRRPADELTTELSAYLGRDELQFDAMETGYALTRNGQPASNLSEGERTAIAFLYFLKSLQDKAFDLKSGIVIIDDPVSSLDANALFSAFGYMKERTKQAGQLFIFTHSFPFFRLAKNWFHHLKKRWKKLGFGSQPTQLYLLQTRSMSGTRESYIGPLDRLLEQHESEYQYIFKRVHEEAHRENAMPLEHHYGMPNVARRLVEAFLAFRFPDVSGDIHARLDRVVFDSSRKTRILRFLNVYSHADAIAEPGNDFSVLAETRGVLLDVLAMIEAVDKDHYDGLRRLLVADGADGDKT